MSYNAFKTVLEIDTIGTFNCSKAVFDKYFKVSHSVTIRLIRYITCTFPVVFHSTSTCFKDHGGVIVNISACLHYKGNMLQAHAGSAKAAIGMY